MLSIVLFYKVIRSERDQMNGDGKMELFKFENNLKQRILEFDSLDTLPSPRD